MKAKIVIVLFMVALLTATVAFAVPQNKTLEFTKSPMGTVVFDGSVHAKAVTSCKDCHKADIFPQMKKGAAAITMKDMNEGKYCGACHNGTVTFNVKANCGRCHKK